MRTKEVSDLFLEKTFGTSDPRELANMYSNEVAINFITQANFCAIFEVLDSIRDRLDKIEGLK